MKNRMGSMTNEFELKLTEMKASIELDYLRRVNALEVCYKELIPTIHIAEESFYSAASLSSKPVMQLQQLLVLLVTASL